MSEPTITVQVELGLDTVVSHEYLQISEDDYADTPIALGEIVAERVAEKLAAKYEQQLRDRLDPLAVARQKVDEAASKLIEDALAQLTQPASRFGEPKGEPKTVAELIDERVTAWLNTKRDTYSRSNLHTVMDAAIDLRWKSELSKTVAEAKKKIVDGLSAEAEHVLSAALAEILTKRAAS